MRITRKMLGATVAMALLTSSSVVANTLRIDRISGHYSGNGGEFTVLPTDSGDLNPSVSQYAPEATYTYPAGHAFGGQTGIQTFCVEFQESVDVPAEYQYDLSDSAVKGGTLSGDRISVGTALLYNQFAQGILGGYNYTPGSGRAADAAILQQAIWWLEDEISLSASAISGNKFLDKVAFHFGSATAGKANDATVGSENVNAAWFGVGAINLGDPALDYPNQDQLYWADSGNTIVPDGGTTLILLGAAMAGIVSLQRLRKQIA